MPDVLSAAAVTAAMAGLPGWHGDPTSIARTVETASFPAAVELVVAVAAHAERVDHHPDIDIRWRAVTFTLSTHSAGGVTALDLALAARIDELAEPGRLRRPTPAGPAGGVDELGAATDGG